MENEEDKKPIKERKPNYEPKLSVNIGSEQTVKLALQFDPKKKGE